MTGTSIDLFVNEDTYLTFQPGDVIFGEGDPGDRMYAVIAGEVDIVVGGRLVDTTTVGGLLGEMAIIDKMPRSATAVAKTECRLVPIDQKRFLFLVQQTPLFAILVMQVMAARHRRLLAMNREA